MDIEKIIKENSIKINYINYGMGYTVSDKGKNIYIELNKNLKKRK